MIVDTVPKKGGHMTFELWLYAVKKLAQTYDAAVMIFNQMSEERQIELRKEFEEQRRG